MPKIVTPLRDVKIAAAKPKDKDYSLADGGGLELLVKTTGRRVWRYRYFRPDGRRNMLSLGDYPGVGLAAARSMREDYAKQLIAETDPGAAKSATPAGSRFIDVAKEWLASQDWGPDHGARVSARFELHLYPALADRPIADITALEMLGVLRKVEAKGFLDIAARMRQQLVLIFRMAVLKGLVKYNPASDLLGNFKNPKATHRPALPLHRLPELLAKIDGYRGGMTVRAALILTTHVFIRSSEIRFARPAEINMSSGMWTIPESREEIKGVKYSTRGAKMGLDHLVPLSPQALAIISKVREDLGGTLLVLPGCKKPHIPISENTINAAFRRMGYCTKKDICGHGLRTMACSALNESGLFNRDAIEKQMSHQERDETRAAYLHKAEYLQERKRMMAWWSAYIEASRSGYIPPWEFSGGI